MKATAKQLKAERVQNMHKVYSELTPYRMQGDFEGLVRNAISAYYGAPLNPTRNKLFAKQLAEAIAKGDIPMPDTKVTPDVVEAYTELCVLHPEYELPFLQAGTVVTKRKAPAQRPVTKVRMLRDHRSGLKAGDIVEMQLSSTGTGSTNENGDACDVYCYASNGRSLYFTTGTDIEVVR